jgi:hypothetical protein
MPKTGVYVAGAVTRREHINEVIETINGIPGCHVTHNWTTVHQSNAQAAVDDIVKGVMPADVTLAILDEDDYRYKGTYHEIGAAMVMRELQGAEVWIYSPYGDVRTKVKSTLPHSVHSCFQQAACRYFSDLEDVYVALSNRVKQTEPLKVNQAV